MTHFESSFLTGSHTRTEVESLEDQLDTLILSILDEGRAGTGAQHYKPIVKAINKSGRHIPVGKIFRTDVGLKKNVNEYARTFLLVKTLKKFRELERICLTDSVVQTLQSSGLLYEWKGPSSQELIESAKFRQPDPVVMRLRKRAVDAVLNGTDWLKAKDVGSRADPEASNPHSIVSRWVKRGEVFSLEQGGVKLFPDYIFDELGNPLPVVKEILKVFENRSAFRIASWFESTSSALGGKRPRELVKSDPDIVLEAARDSVLGVQHG